MAFPIRAASSAGAQVHLNDFVHPVGAQIHHALRVGDARVVDQDIQSAIGCQGLLSQPLDPVQLDEICSDRGDRHPVIFRESPRSLVQ